MNKSVASGTKYPTIAELATLDSMTLEGMRTALGNPAKFATLETFTHAANLVRAIRESKLNSYAVNLDVSAESAILVLVSELATRKITQVKIAQIVGISQPTVSKLLQAVKFEAVGGDRKAFLMALTKGTHTAKEMLAMTDKARETANLTAETHKSATKANKKAGAQKSGETQKGKTRATGGKTNQVEPQPTAEPKSLVTGAEMWARVCTSLDSMVQLSQSGKIDSQKLLDKLVEIASLVETHVTK